MSYAEKKFETVSDARAEKYQREVQGEKRRERLRQEKIAYRKASIESEKAAIKDCLDQGYYSIAKMKIMRIEMLQEEIFKIQSS